MFNLKTINYEKLDLFDFSDVRDGAYDNQL